MEIRLPLMDGRIFLRLIFIYGRTESGCMDKPGSAVYPNFV